jgi:uncharacterized protein YPO0396
MGDRIVVTLPDGYLVTAEEAYNKASNLTDSFSYFYKKERDRLLEKEKELQKIVGKIDQSEEEMKKFEDENLEIIRKVLGKHTNEICNLKGRITKLTNYLDMTNEALNDTLLELKQLKEYFDNLIDTKLKNFHHRLMKLEHKLLDAKEAKEE